MSPAYRLLILPRAAKELGGLPKEAYARVRDACRSLANDPRPKGSCKLAGRPGLRIRVGDLRVIYEADDTARTVTILHVGHRRDVYR
ncbi:MAG: type II toxin-antitoxin system RelE family toxin [Planctomycetota bacterium]